MYVEVCAGPLSAVSGRGICVVKLLRLTVPVRL